MFKKQIRQFHKKIKEEKKTRRVLKNLDLFVLDNSLRESTVGQLRGHTMENKWAIYEQVKKAGFKNMIVASFSHMTRLGDSFIEDLREKGEDFTHLWGFSEFVESVKKGKPDSDTIPIGLVKMKKLGINNAIIEMDLVYHAIDYEIFTMDKICKVVSDRLKWCRDNLSKDCKVLFNLRDFGDCMMREPERLLHVVHYLSSLPPDERPFGIAYEESGKYLPEEVGAMTATVREEMDNCGFTEGHLLTHCHEQWGLKDATQLECLANGANGIWASLCEEGASMGHSCSAVMLLNLIRLGNKKVLKRYNCTELRRAAQAVCRITTGREPHIKQVVFGERALDMVFGMDQFLPDEKEFSLPAFFGEEPVMRMTTLASPAMIVCRLTRLFGESEQFTEERAQRMKEVMLEDLHANRKEEYMSAAGIAILFDRSGGKLTEKMGEVVSKAEVGNEHHKEILAEVRKMWEQWDLEEEGTKGDDCLEFDSFYNGFMARFFGCYRCDETKRALKAIDMDSDGRVDWSEFAVYLKWALRQYPDDITDGDKLLDIAFRKGLIPAMQDMLVETVQAAKK